MAKYKTLISRSDKEIEKEMLDNTVEEGSIQIQSDILGAKKSVSSSEKALKTAKAAIPFNSANIISRQRDLLVAQTNLTALETLQKEMF